MVKNINKQRIIAMRDWFTGLKQTALTENEMVMGITIPLIKIKHYSCYEKLARYSGEDLAQAGVGIIALEDRTYRIAFCAVGPVPCRSQRIENMLKGKEISESLLEDVKIVICDEISPINDIRACKNYREHMIKVMLERGLQKVTSSLNGGKDD